MHKLRILILYPDPAGLALLTSMLNSLGHDIEEATDDRAAVRLMERQGIDLVLAGVEPADDDALELLTYARRKHREVPVILLFPRAHPDRAKEALRQGAMAVLKYPIPAAELRAAVLQALDQSGGRPARDPVGGNARPAADSKPAAVPPTASGGLPPTPAPPPPPPRRGPGRGRDATPRAVGLGYRPHRSRSESGSRVIDLAGISPPRRGPRC